MKMKTSIQRPGKITGGLKITGLVLPFLLLLCSFKQEKKSNLQKSPVVKKELKIDGSFKKILVRGNVSIVLTNDAAGTVIIEGKEKLVSKIKSVFENNTLSVDLTPNRWFAKLTIYLSAKTLESLQVNGDGNISSFDFIQSDHLHISLNGDIKVKVKTLGQLSFDAPDDIELLTRRPVIKMIK
jgi:hypothetical protein